MNTITSQRALRAALVAALALGTSVAFAGTETATLGVSATVSNNCHISADSAVAFGTFDSLNGSAAPGTGTISVQCTNGASASVALDEGANADTGSSASAPARRMKSGSSYLSYNLYTDEGHASVWGGDTAAVSVTGTGLSTPMTVYGQIAASQQSAPAGSYSDTVSATVTF